MKDENITLMFNADAPHIHFVLSAGQKIDIKVPGTYEVVPISLNKIVAGYSSYKNNEVYEDNENLSEDSFAGNISQDNQDNTIESPETNSIFELNQPRVPELVQDPIKGGNPINLLFTQNLSKLLADARYK